MEEIIQELRELAKRKPLTDNMDKTRASQIMTSLIGMGYSNPEIVRLSGGAWSLSNIKNYTRGARVSDPAAKNDALKLLTDLVDSDLTLEDVESTLSMKSMLESRNVTLAEVAALISDADQSQLPLDEFITLHREKTASGLTFGQLKESLELHSQMRQENMTIDSLRKIIEASKSLGGYARVLDAIASYGSLVNLNSQVKQSTSDLAKLEQHVQRLKTDVNDLAARKSSIESELKAHDRLRALGFNEETLQEIEECTVKYGGPQQILEAINSYVSNAQIKEESADLVKERTVFESKRMKAEAEYSHLQTVIDMVSTLLYKRKFSVQAITDVYALAERLGEPLTVIRAVEKFGEIAAMQSHLDKLTMKHSELEKLVNDLGARADEIKQRTETSLELLSNTVVTTVENIRNAGEESVRKVGTYAEGKMSALAIEYETYSGKLGELKVDAGRLEDEVMMGRLIWSVLTDPTVAASFPSDWIKKLVTAASLFCERKDFNPVVRIPFELANGSNRLYIDSKAGVADLLRWASIGFSPKTA